MKCVPQYSVKAMCRGTTKPMLISYLQKILSSHMSGRMQILKTLSICPPFTAYILVTMGLILMQLCENVGNLVRLIVVKELKELK